MKYLAEIKASNQRQNTLFLYIRVIFHLFSLLKK